MTDRARSGAWADPRDDEIRALIRRSSEVGWREALREHEETASFFVERMENLALGNWQIFLGPSGLPTVLDIGCGFGSITLGSSAFSRLAVGIDPLPERVGFAALRARQAGDHNAAFVQGDGLSTPFQSETFSLVTFNGVLEWAGLFADGEPRDLQREMLEEASRLTSAHGAVCVAIENSLAAETLLGLRDTHTDTHFLTAFPEPFSSWLLRMRKGNDPRVRLYSRRGYMKLFSDAGFSHTRMFNLIPSYNNYRFILGIDDIASHQFVYRHFDTGDFYEPAARVRQFLARKAPGLLPGVAYSYLIIGQQSDSPTLLDPEFPVWEDLAIPAGMARFGVQMETPGAGGILVHREDQPHSFLKWWPRTAEEPAIPTTVKEGLGRGLREKQRKDFRFLTLAQYNLAPQP